MRNLKVIDGVAAVLSVGVVIGLVLGQVDLRSGVDFRPPEFVIALLVIGALVNWVLSFLLLIDDALSSINRHPKLWVLLLLGLLFVGACIYNLYRLFWKLRKQSGEGLVGVTTSNG